MVGTCMTMCPEKEVVEREMALDLSVSFLLYYTHSDGEM